MGASDKDTADETSIKPVSSLLCHFESLGAKSDLERVASRRKSSRLTPSPNAGIDDVSHRTSSRLSLGAPDHGSLLPNTPAYLSDTAYDSPLSAHEGMRSRSHVTRGRQRPVSMGPWSPAHSPPRLRIHSPHSPPRNSTSSNSLRSEASNSGSRARTIAVEPRLPANRRSKTLSRPSTPTKDGSAPTPSTRLDHGLAEVEIPKLSPFSHSRVPKSSSTPPPVNRADKPKISARIGASRKLVSATSLDPSTVTTPEDNRISPFSTPPGSDGCPSPERQPREIYRHSVAADMIGTLTTPYADTFQTRLPLNNTNRHMSPIRSFPSTQDQGGAPLATPCHEVRATKVIPILPPRRGEGHRSQQSQRLSTSIKRDSALLQIPAKTGPAGISTMSQISRQNTGSISRGNSTKLHHSQFSRTGSVSYHEDARIPSQNHSDDRKQIPDDHTSNAIAATNLTTGKGNYPDISQVNRRPPYLRTGHKEIPTLYDTRLLDVCGSYVCTSGYVTKVWDLRTAELWMSLNHQDTVKITALAFKPGKGPDDEGTRIWLGSSNGELQEIDIPSRSVVFSKSGAHSHREILKIHRHKREMWAIDDDGKLTVWAPDEDGTPNLQYSPQSFRVARGYTFSILVGDCLWLASGKEIRIYWPGCDSAPSFQVLQSPLTQPSVGEVTSGTTIRRQTSVVIFGHADGKVTIYDARNYNCLGIINISAYKINSLAGVGSKLWAAFNTGMVYVYDIDQTPWKVKKDWRAHDGPVASLVADQASTWRLGRLQMASLGGDNLVRFWDGMLQDDWLETEMQSHDIDYAEFREVTATIVTWNAGASTPSDLRYDDLDFFHRIFQEREPPDIVVFGFQELVDLEDKKLTAKSIFRGSKKKDSSDQEHMSRQYRKWRDFLTRTLEECMPISEPYTVLHTATLVGLFTCVFVKTSELHKIHDLHCAEVKRGMGGLHGNKGALILRFHIDDTSLCFVNCHLAAGQTQTVHRNNDIAAILETDTLPNERNPSSRIDHYVGGGDGSMISDHQICILNGDLNYRIDTMSRDTVVRAVKENNFGKLLERDQLLLSRRRNPTFRLRAFNEMPILFAPTYKYDVGTDDYDTSEKRRSPAWCDRILCRGAEYTKQLDYRRHEIRTSDHRPVSGAFKIRVKRISPKRRNVVWENCEQKLLEMKRNFIIEASINYLVDILGIPKTDARKMIENER